MNWQATENQKKIIKYRDEGYDITITADGYSVTNPKGKYLGGASVMLPRRKPLHYRHRIANIENYINTVVVIIEREIVWQNLEEYNRLTKAQKKIYDSVMETFPASSHGAAYDAAIQGGVKFQFICK